MGLGTQGDRDTDSRNQGQRGEGTRGQGHQGPRAVVALVALVLMGQEGTGGGIGRKPWRDCWGEMGTGLGGGWHWGQGTLGTGQERSWDRG